MGGVTRGTYVIQYVARGFSPAHRGAAQGEIPNRKRQMANKHQIPDQCFEFWSL